MQITHDVASEDSVHEYSVFASDVGISPGAWAPGTLSTNMGNGLDFILQSVDESMARYPSTIRLFDSYTF